MPKMTAEIFDSPTRYLVTSEEHGEKKRYLVDMGRGKNWHCECKDFRARQIPKLKNGATRQEAHCKHQRFLLAKFAWGMLDAIIDNEIRNAEKNKERKVVFGNRRAE